MGEARLRALVLGAGRGERLRPLTDIMPKPLLPILGRPVIEQTLGALAAAGCEATAINLHHLGAAIEDRFGGAFQGMRLTYSRETALLGTLGALGPLAEFAAKPDLLIVVNGDSLCRWPLAKLVRRHRSTGAAATLLLTTRASPKRFGGGVVVRRDGSIKSLRGGVRGDQERRRVFAGAHVFAPELLTRATKTLGDEPADFVDDLYEPLLHEGELLQGHETRRHWHDLGTPERYLEGAHNWGLGRWPRRLWRSNWFAPGTEVSAQAQVQGSVIERGAILEAGCRVELSLILSGAHIGSGSRIRRAIVGPGVVVPEGSTIKRRMVTAARADLVPRATDSNVGGLVYSRLEGAR
jgi:NDP-sugar pyrophosphorylase family protein